jgi:hypothetical protein
MISIRAFTDHVIKMSDEKHLFEPVDWNAMLADHGYVPVPIGVRVRKPGERTDMRAWCNEQFGEEHYVWTGSNYWFETESDAIMFALRWGRDN